MNDPKSTLKPPSTKERVLADIRIAIWAVPLLLIAVLLVLELTPTANTSNLTVSTPITVTSEIVKVQSGQYATTISGALYNPTDAPITIEKIRIDITAEQGFRGVDFDGFTLHPRTSEELYLSWRGGTDFNRVSRITVTINGEEQVVHNSNLQSEPVVRGAVIFYLVITAIVAFFLIRAIKLRYYLHQEAMFLKV